VLAALALLSTLGLRGHRADAANAHRVAFESPSGPLENVFACYLRARSETPLDRRQVDELCEGVNDAGPVDCYLAARAHTFLSVEEAMSLCHCAASDEPVACYRAGSERTTLDPSAIRRLCSPQERLRLEPDCSPQERVRLEPDGSPSP